MTADELAEARRLVDAATPGPWRWSDWSATFGTIESKERRNTLTGDDDRPTAPQIAKRTGSGRFILHVDDPIDHHDAAFIAAAPALLRSLLSHVAKLEAQLATAATLALERYQECEELHAAMGEPNQQVPTVTQRLRADLATANAEATYRIEAETLAAKERDACRASLAVAVKALENISGNTASLVNRAVASSALAEIGSSK